MSERDKNLKLRGTIFHTNCSLLCRKLLETADIAVLMVRNMSSLGIALGNNNRVSD